MHFTTFQLDFDLGALLPWRELSVRVQWGAERSCESWLGAMAGCGANTTGLKTASMAFPEQKGNETVLLNACHYTCPLVFSFKHLVQGLLLNILVLGETPCWDNSVIASITALLFPWLQLNDMLRTIAETSLGNPTLYNPGDIQIPGSLSSGPSNFRELHVSKEFQCWNHSQFQKDLPTTKRNKLDG